MAEIEDLGTVIDESTVRDAQVDEVAGALRLRLAIVAHPASGTATQRVIGVEFSHLGRLAVRLRRVESVTAPTPEQPWRTEWRADCPAVPALDLAGLNEWLQRFRGDLYGRPVPRFDRPVPEWLAEASLDKEWEGSIAHTVDLSFDTTPGSDGRVMELRAWFGDVALSGGEGQPLEAEVVVEAVKSWWRDFKAGNTDGESGIVPAGE